MYDIKYFFSIKLIRQIREGLPKILPKNIIFQNPGTTAPLAQAKSAPGRN
jgi:hypothetical protein